MPTTYSKEDIIMSLVHKVFAAEVHPALGCTELGAIALAGAIAGKHAQAANPGVIQEVLLRVDPGTFKNGSGVIVPNCDGARGLSVAAAAGIVLGPLIESFDLQVLSHASPHVLTCANVIVPHISTRVCMEWEHFRVEACVITREHSITVIIDGHHTNVISVIMDDEELSIPPIANGMDTSSNGEYQRELADLTLQEIIALAQSIDEETRKYIRAGVAMNHRLAEAGMAEGNGVGQHIRRIMCFLMISHADASAATQMYVAGATDARMRGCPLPAMSSGNSGNQGFVAILVPDVIGRRWSIDARRIEEAIALSHLLNAYAKCFLGNLSPLCGCAVSAGIGAAAGVAYLKKDSEKTIGAAIQNLLSMIGGVICDGAKESCALKVAAAAHASIMAATLAIDECAAGNHGITSGTALESIRNLGAVCSNGMRGMDGAILNVLEKNLCC